MLTERKHHERVRTAALFLMGVVVAMLGIGAGLTYAVVLAVKDTEVLDGALVASGGEVTPLVTSSNGVRQGEHDVSAAGGADALPAAALEALAGELAVVDADGDVVATLAVAGVERGEGYVLFTLQGGRCAVAADGLEGGTAVDVDCAEAAAATAESEAGSRRLLVALEHGPAGRRLRSKRRRSLRYRWAVAARFSLVRSEDEPASSPPASPPPTPPTPPPAPPPTPPPPALCGTGSFDADGNDLHLMCSSESVPGSSSDVMTGEKVPGCCDGCCSDDSCPEGRCTWRDPQREYSIAGGYYDGIEGEDADSDQLEQADTCTTSPITPHSLTSHQGPPCTRYCYLKQEFGGHGCSTPNGEGPFYSVPGWTNPNPPPVNCGFLNPNCGTP